MRTALLSVCLAACGGGDGDSFQSVDTTDPSKFCRASASTVCGKWFSCLTQDERDERDIPPTLGECERAFESSCERGVDDCIDETHGYAGDQAATCLAEMNRAQCNDAVDPWLDAPACKQVCERTAGVFQLRWRFEPFHVCSELRVRTVTLLSRTASKQFVDTFDCDDGAGVTDFLPVGRYDLRVELHDDQNQRVWFAERGSDDIDAAVVTLPELVIPVAP